MTDTLNLCSEEFKKWDGEVGFDYDYDSPSKVWDAAWEAATRSEMLDNNRVVHYECILNAFIDAGGRFNIRAAAERLAVLELRNGPGEISLEEENFSLAANQCHHGYGDEYGNHRCKYQDEIAALKKREPNEITVKKYDLVATLCRGRCAQKGDLACMALGADNSTPACDLCIAQAEAILARHTKREIVAIPKDRLESLEAHMDEGGKTDNAIVYELLGYIKELSK